MDHNEYEDGDLGKLEGKFALISNRAYARRGFVYGGKFYFVNIWKKDTITNYKVEVYESIPENRNIETSVHQINKSKMSDIEIAVRDAFVKGSDKADIKLPIVKKTF